MNDVSMLAFSYKGFHNLYPVYVHYSKEFGTFVMPRVFPRVYEIWADWTCKLFKDGEGIVHITYEILKPFYMPSYYLVDDEDNPCL